MMRLFVGLQLPEGIQDLLLDLREEIPGARWIDAHNLHMTLSFIGEVDGHEADEIDYALSRINFAPFDLTLGGVGLFSHSNKSGRTLWAGVKPNPQLMHLQMRVANTLRSCGLGPDRRKFRPHVSLARVKHSDIGQLGLYMERNNLFSSPSFQIENFVLYRSHLTRNGPHYEALNNYPQENDFRWSPPLPQYAWA